MIGRRIQIEDLQNVRFAPGDYGRDPQGRWWCRCPRGSMGNLSQHEVTEHEDGTITVSPSILIDAGSQPEQNWHGHLERGVWREC